MVTKSRQTFVYSDNIIPLQNPSKKHGTKYSRMDHVKFVEDSLSKIWRGLPWADHTPPKFLKADFNKFYLAHSWLLCPICHTIWTVLLDSWNFQITSTGYCYTYFVVADPENSKGRQLFSKMCTKIFKALLFRNYGNIKLSDLNSSKQLALLNEEYFISYFW